MSFQWLAVFVLIAASAKVFAHSTQVAAISATAANAPVANQLQRIASVNICNDLLLWSLVSHQRLVSLSYLTANPLWSPIAEEVGDIPVNHGLAEEIVPYKPDLVLAGEFDAAASVELLRRLNVRVERILLPRNLSDISKQIVQLANLVNANAQAELLINAINTQIAELKNLRSSHSPLRAYWYSSNGVVVGANTLEHELMTLAGLTNIAAEQGIIGFSPLNIELLLSAKPQLIIVEESNAGAYSRAREYLAHPALSHAGLQIIHLPAGLSGCAATTMVEVAQALQQQLIRLYAAPKPATHLSSESKF